MEGYRTEKEWMERENRRYIYICEGATDEDKLKKLGCLFVVKTGGKFIKKDIISFLQLCYKVRELVIITDPDGPGRDIKNYIEEKVGPCHVIEAKKADAIKKGKVGIAQREREDLKKLLRPYIRHDITVDENLSFEDETFEELGLTGAGSKAKRRKLVGKYHLIYTSSKNVEDARLRLCKTREELREDIQG